MLANNYDLKPGDKVFLDFKIWGREIRASLVDVEVNEGDILEVASVGEVFALIKEFNQTLPKAYIKLACEICQKKSAFKEGRYRKCISCARKERDDLRHKFLGILSDEELEAFLAYEKASEDFSSMCILD